MYRIFTEFYRICHATFRIMKIHEESELCITNATFQNYDSADINNHPNKHPIHTNKTWFEKGLFAGVGRVSVPCGGEWEKGAWILSHYAYQLYIWPLSHNCQLF